MAKMLRFGGPKLPEGTHTWYLTKTPAGAVSQVDAHPGHVVEANLVLKHSADGPEGMILTPNASYYVDALMASYVDDPED